MKPNALITTLLCVELASGVSPLFAQRVTDEHVQELIRAAAQSAGIQQPDLRRPGQQHTHPQPTTVVRVKAQPSEGVGVAACEKGVEVGVCEHRQVFKLFTDQTRSTYSAIVRSDENGPMPAMLRSARSAQAVRSANNVSTLAWVAT